MRRASVPVLQHIPANTRRIKIPAPTQEEEGQNCSVPLCSTSQFPQIINAALLVDGGLYSQMLHNPQ
jgi:hypothetical protein